MSVTAIILTYNEASNIEDCLASLKWADTIVVFDSFSTDNTIELAKRAGVQVIQNQFVNYTLQRNAALDAVDAEWVLFIDADERITSELSREIKIAIQSDQYDGYWIPRHNYIFGKLTRYTGWYPDYQLRLMRRDRARYDTSLEVHELVILPGKAGYLKTPLIHYNYRDLAQFIAKQERYTSYAASDLYKQGVRVKPQNYILQPLRHFWWRFVALQGYRDGIHGLKLSLLMAWYEFQKYVRLRREWKHSVG